MAMRFALALLVARVSADTLDSRLHALEQHVKEATTAQGPLFSDPGFSDSPRSMRKLMHHRDSSTCV